MSSEQQKYTRFSLVQRIEHVVMFTSFIILAATGLPQKFASAGISVALINLYGGIDTTRQIHHVAAIVLLLSAAFHIVALGYRIYVERRRPSMLPVVKDIRDGIGAFLYNLGARKNRPQYGRYTWEEKVEYWSLVWGILVMALTGFFMWNPIATTSILPGEVIPAAKTAHGWEAVLAVVAVIIWHFYSVHLRHFNRSMFTGKQTEHEMLEEHPLELADIKAGTAQRPLEPQQKKRRQLIYFPIATVVGVGLAVVILRFMTFEQTAIETVQAHVETVPVFAPLAPTPFPTAQPTPTPQPTVAVANADWTTVGAILEKECASCHNGSVAGLDYTTYAGAMKGSTNGPVIKPGDPENSLIVKKVAGGTHPGKLSPAELEALKTWIANGAPQTGAGVPVTAPTSSPSPGEVWTGGIDQLVNAKCAACHVNATLGDLSLKTYTDALKGGKDGAAIVPGDPDKSMLVKIQSTGGHPGQLSKDELDRVIAWIKAGAPETAGSSAAPFVTATPTTSTSAATATPANSSSVESAQWSDFAAKLSLKCGTCHVNTQLGGLSLKTYADVLKGGKSGPAVVPGDPDKSVLVQVMQKGDHPNLLSPEELQALITWIQAGAPEKAGSPATLATPAVSTTLSSSTRWSDVAQILTAKCAACHINTQTSGLSLKTYADALKGGQSGPAIVPGEPDKSVLVQVQQKGGHPGQLSPDDLALIVAWIKSGAPEQ